MRKMWTEARGRWERLLAEFGTIALVTYLVIALVVFVGFVIAIRMGFQVESAAANAGTFGAAWIGLKLTQPIRIGATVALTPLVAWAVRRGQPAQLAPDPETESPGDG
jgi:hypothetical protein